ncbi:MAG: UDP-glucose 4-epimerase GalE [Acidobacteria bacterium]|nr:UDP-glucose 4-epimerase GalE [Acidobacteriota bacterium]
MHVLVAGGAGYIGSTTAKALSRAGHVPVVFDNLEKGHREAVRWGPFVEGDLADRAQLADTFRRFPIEGVIHFAAYIAVGESMREPVKYFRNNVANTLNLLEAMTGAGVRRIVFSSTAAVYGDPETTPIPEDHPLRPVSPYGESKLMVERLLEWFNVTHQIRPARLRYFNAAGADPDGETGENHDPETHLIPLALAAAAGDRDALELFGSDYPTADGTPVRDYIHVTDLADAHVRALDWLAGGGLNLTANLGTGEGFTVRQVLGAVEQVTGRPVPFVERPRRAGDPAVLIADSGRARRMLGWTPTHSSLEQIIGTAWNWYGRNRPELSRGRDTSASPARTAPQ